MKTICTITILSALLYNCSPNRYLLTDSGTDKYYLSDYIKSTVKKGELSKHPVIVVNVLPYDYKSLKEKKLTFSKNSIKQIGKLSSEDASLLGISTNALRVTILPSVTFSRYGRALILLDGKRISTAELDAIDANSIDTISVLKGAEQVKNYTDENYEGVIVLSLKKG